MNKTNTNNNQEYGVDALKRIRDELAVQAHLFSLEMKDEWKVLEKDWQHLQTDLQPAKKAVDQAKMAGAKSIEQVRSSLEKAYGRFMDKLKSSGS